MPHDRPPQPWHSLFLEIDKAFDQPTMFPAAYRRLLLMVLEAHDLALSKLERNSARDREDVRFLARAVPLDPVVLESRYRSELRPYLANQERHDLTLRLWLEMLRDG